MRRIKAALLSILLIIIIGIAGYVILAKVDIFSIGTNKSSEISLVQDKLVELSEWTTLRYDYRNVIVSRTERSLSLPIISDIQFAETIKLIEYTGYLKAGTDLSKVEITYDETSQQYKVRVPKSRILDNVVETENTKVEDLKGSILSDYPTQTILDEINASKKTLEEEKISQGFLEEADLRISALMISFLKSFDFDNVVIEFY